MLDYTNLWCVAVLISFLVAACSAVAIHIIVEGE